MVNPALPIPALPIPFASAKEMFSFAAHHVVQKTAARLPSLKSGMPTNFLHEAIASLLHWLHYPMT